MRTSTDGSEQVMNNSHLSERILLEVDLNEEKRRISILERDFFSMNINLNLI